MLCLLESREYNSHFLTLQPFPWQHLMVNDRVVYNSDIIIILLYIPSAEAISVEVCGMCWLGNWIGEFGRGFGDCGTLTLSDAILLSVSSSSVLSLSFCMCSCW